MERSVTDDIGGTGVDVGNTGSKPMTVEEYRQAIEGVKKLGAALDVLHNNGLESAAGEVGGIVQNLCDGLASGLAGTARWFAATLGKDGEYHVDDIYEALGRYAYHASDDSGADHLTHLGYCLERLYEKVAKSVLPEPEPEAAPEPITEYEREQVPDPGLIRN